MHSTAINPVSPRRQMDLFGSILQAYEGKGSLSNDELYSELLSRGAISEDAIHTRAPVGRSGQMHSLGRRQVRWHQQTLKKLGLLDRVEGSRGVWRAAAKPKGDLTPASPGVVMVAFSTKLGAALWASCHDVFARIDEPIHLCLTSPPYCLAQPRAYGNPSQAEYVDFICTAMEPIVRNLAPGGSICLNVSNDIFVQGSPARSMVRERLALAMHDRLGLHLMDQLIWSNPSKAPGPIAWASKKRVQLNVAYEPIYWFTNDPHLVRSDNRRVLQPHSERHQKLMSQGGESREAVYGDGANRMRPGAFGRITDGKIPRNIITAGHRCAHQTPARNAAKAAGLPVHGAAMPFAVADLLVRFLTEEGDLVADPFGGIQTTAEAAERNGRRWLTTELHYEYGYAGSYRLADCPEFSRFLSL